MINIQVKQEVETVALCRPFEMLGHKWPHGQVFQQYFDGVPQKDFYITCGACEPSVIHLWFNDDEKFHRLSTDNKESLLELNNAVLVAPIEANVSITLEI